jgi:hypothetical protein
MRQSGSCPSVPAAFSYRDTHLLNPNKVEWLHILALDFQTQLNGLSYAYNEFIEGFCLGVTSPQGRNRCYVVAFPVTLYDYTELFCHIGSTRQHVNAGVSAHHEELLSRER